MANSNQPSKISARLTFPVCEKSYNKCYFEAARRVGKRSLLGVNEHFSPKADAERALLDGF